MRLVWYFVGINSTDESRVREERCTLQARVRLWCSELELLVTLFEHSDLSVCQNQNLRAVSSQEGKIRFQWEMILEDQTHQQNSTI